MSDQNAKQDLKEIVAAADEFVAQVIKAALKSAPDGLNILEELAKAVPKQRMSDNR
jgi:hypothetical protein